MTGVLIVLISALVALFAGCGYLWWSWYNGPTQNIESAKKLIGTEWRLDDDPFTNYHYKIVDAKISSDGNIWLKFSRPSGCEDTMKAENFLSRYEKLN